LRQKAEEYRIAQGGVKESTKKDVKQRITKLNRAIAALEDQDLLKNVAADLEDKYNADYVTATINRLKDEINRLEAVFNWQPPAKSETTVSQPPPQPSTKKKGKDYGLLSGLGYGYFY
jgi:arginine/lysine/ornithine decarboxylase